MSEYPKELLEHGVCEVPRFVAICPECQSTIYVEVTEWDTDTKRATYCGIDLNCNAEEQALMDWEQAEDGTPFSEVAHRWHQSEWQPVRDAVAKWLGVQP